jgi:hypothetical protein
MLILTAQNVTGDGKLEKDGLADYDVWIGVNHHQIWSGRVEGHVRSERAESLLRKIADALEHQVSGPSKPSPVDEAIVRVMEKPTCPKCGSPKLSCINNGCTWSV